MPFHRLVLPLVTMVFTLDDGDAEQRLDRGLDLGLGRRRRDPEHDRIGLRQHRRLLGDVRREHDVVVARVGRRFCGFLAIEPGLQLLDRGAGQDQRLVAHDVVDIGADRRQQVDALEVRRSAGETDVERVAVDHQRGLAEAELAELLLAAPWSCLP